MKNNVKVEFYILSKKIYNIKIIIFQIIVYIIKYIMYTLKPIPPGSKICPTCKERFISYIKWIQNYILRVMDVNTRMCLTYGLGCVFMYVIYVYVLMA